MQYALLIYRSHDPDLDPAAAAASFAAVLAHEAVTGWVRLHPDESATTVRHALPDVLLTDGPFIDTKEYLAGLIFVEADNLDGALAVARELQGERDNGAIEVRPVLESAPRDA